MYLLKSTKFGPEIAKYTSRRANLIKPIKNGIMYVFLLATDTYMPNFGEGA